MGDETQIFLAAADRSSPPRLAVRAGDMVSYGAGQLIFRQLGGKADYLARVQEDGGAPTRILETPIIEKGGVSPDGEWATFTGGMASVQGTFAVSMRDHIPQRICAAECVVQWSADGKYLYVTVTTAKYWTSAGLTYVIPIPQGFGHLDLPPSGIDLATGGQLAGYQSIREGVVSPGPDTQTYAFTNAAFLGNLFRIPLH